MKKGGHTILVVEDERPLAKALELKLSKEGYTVTIAPNGEEAVSMLSKDSFDVMILDLVMPKFDGFHVLEHVEKEKLKIQVIVLSNLSQSEDMKKAKQFGAVDYFVKSNTPIVTLVAEVKKLIGK